MMEKWIQVFPLETWIHLSKIREQGKRI